jgi:hypothetical protein
MLWGCVALFCEQFLIEKNSLTFYFDILFLTVGTLRNIVASCHLRVVGLHLLQGPYITLSGRDKIQYFLTKPNIV